MSKDHSERAEAWGEWIQEWTDGPRIPIAFFHHCGGMGAISPGEDLGDVTCRGCRITIQDPGDGKCTPLYPPGLCILGLIDALDEENTRSVRKFVAKRYELSEAWKTS